MSNPISAKMARQFALNRYKITAMMNGSMYAFQGSLEPLQGCVSFY